MPAAAQVQTIAVPDEHQLRAAIDSYIIQGFTVATRESGAVTMRKAKEFNVVWAVIGFALCLLPLLIYCIVYSQEQDKVVVIRIGGARQPTLQLTDDSRFWWNGSQWIPLTATSPPPGVQISEDRRFWWDGSRWNAFVPELTV